ncbi:MAG: PAS domain S-box protein [Myxococcales bacterium]
MSQEASGAHALTRRYVFALGLVALLSLTSQALIQSALVRHESDARVVNVAGRQRMLSQRLSKTALEMGAQPTAEAPLGEFEQTLLAWRSAHAGLQRGDLVRGLPGRNTPAVAQLFADADRHFHEMDRAAEQLLAARRAQAGHGDLRPPIITILTAEDLFLVAMDRVVTRYQWEAEQKVHALRRVELLLTSFTLLVLALEALLVFKPAVERVERTIAGLTRTRQELSQSRAELESKVTERTAELQQSEQQFRLIFEAAIVGMAQVDAGSGRFLRANPVFCRMLGYAEQELLERTFVEVTHPEDRSADRTRFERVKSGELPSYQARKRYVRKDGSSVLAQVSSALIRDERGHPQRTVTIVQDVSAQVAAEEALRRSEDHFHALADMAPQIVWVADADLRFQYFNPRWNEYSGLPAGDARALAFYSCIHPDDRDRFEACFRESREHETPFEIQHRLRARSGEYRWHLTRAQPRFDEHGSVSRWFGTTTDIENQKRSQLAAEDESRNKDEFVALVSHELRTPLSAILGWSALLRERGMERSLVERATRVIERNAQTQAQLVEDLLDMSRVLSGKLELDRQPLELESVLHSALDTVRPSADAKSIELSFAPAELSARVSGDARRLQQIFWNLLNNAIKFTPERGRVEIGLRYADKVWVEIRDNGLGIDPAFLPHVFERFQQGQRSGERSHGLGLGLALVKHLVELHGGSITAQSEGLGHGACFTVALPSVAA